VASNKDVFVILSPPRSCSTLIARIFWEHPNLGFFVMEPFDGVYQGRRSADDAMATISQPRPLTDMIREERTGSAVLIKEITYQVDEYFTSFIRFTTRPVLFAVRDPRLTISSRMTKLREGGRNSIFPHEESGWTALHRQVQFCRAQSIRYLIIDGTLLRCFPAQLISKIFETVGLPQTEPPMSWRPVSNVDFGIGEGLDYFFDRALRSTSVEPPDSSIPEITTFPAEGGMRQHVYECLEIYKEILDDDNYVRPTPR
jgi:hypothetical protein